MAKLSNKEIALVHIAAKAVGVGKDQDEELYKDTLFAHGGAASAKDLSRDGFNRLMEHFEKCGFERKKQRRRGYKGRPKNMDGFKSRQKQLQKIEALLTIGKRPWSYADSLAKRICRNKDGLPIERISWVPTGQLFKIITALRKQAKREGWDLSGELG